jgi:hypothetical protein
METLQVQHHIQSMKHYNSNITFKVPTMMQVSLFSHIKCSAMWSIICMSEQVFASIINGDNVFLLQYALEPSSERLKYELILMTTLNSLHNELQVSS